MRWTVLSLISIGVVVFSMGYFMEFDTRGGIAFGLSTDWARVYTGYRYTGFEIHYMFGSLVADFSSAVDPFNTELNFETDIGFDISFLSLKLSGELFLNPSRDSTKTGVVLTGFDTEIRVENFRLKARIHTTPLVMIHYPPEEGLEFYYLFPPTDPKDLVLNSKLDIAVGFEMENFRIDLGYSVSFGFLRGVPSPLLDLNGVYLRIFMESVL